MVHGFHLLSFSGQQQMHDSLDAIKAFISQKNYYSTSSTPLTRSAYQAPTDETRDVVSEPNANDGANSQTGVESVLIDENQATDNFQPENDAVQGTFCGMES